MHHDLEVEEGHQEALVLVEEVGVLNLEKGLLAEVEVEVQVEH